MVKNSPANEGHASSIPGSGRLPGGRANHSTILAWEIPWTEDTERLQSMGSQNIQTRFSDWTRLQQIVFSKDGHNPHNLDTHLTKGICLFTRSKLSGLHACFNQRNRWKWHQTSSRSSLYWLEAASSSLRKRKKTRWGALANNTGWAFSWHQLPVMWEYHLGYPTPVSIQLTPASSVSLPLKWTVPSANCLTEPGQIPELSDIIKFYLKPLSFEVVCYIAIDNQNTEINFLA